MKKNLSFLAIFMVAVTSAFADNVCKNTSTSTEYATVQAAIDAVTEGQTIQLTADIDLTATITVKTTTPAFTLDLNGNVLKQTGSNCSVITNEGNLTIVDNYTGTAPTHTIGTETFTGGIITGGNVSYGGAIYNDGTLTVSGGTFTGNSATDKGGAIYSDNGTLTVTGGSITGNSASSAGGAIYSDNGTLTVTGGTFTENSSGWAGAIMNYVNGTLTVTGGSITGNSASIVGGAIYNAGILTLCDGTVIKNNTSTGGYLGGGVYSWKDDYNSPKSSVSISGKVVITDNTTTLNGEGSALNANLCFSGYNESGNPFEPMTIIDLKEGTSIGITTENNDVVGAYQFTLNGAESDLQYFTADNSNYKIKYNTSGYLETVEKPVITKQTLQDAIAECKAHRTNFNVPEAFLIHETGIELADTICNNESSTNEDYYNAKELLSLAHTASQYVEYGPYGKDLSSNPKQATAIRNKIYEINEEMKEILNLVYNNKDAAKLEEVIANLQIDVDQLYTLVNSNNSNIATGISDVNATVVKNGKFIENDKLYIFKKGVKYNTTGTLSK